MRPLSHNEIVIYAQELDTLMEDALNDPRYEDYKDRLADNTEALKNSAVLKYLFTMRLMAIRDIYVGHIASIDRHIQWNDHFRRTQSIETYEGKPGAVDHPVMKFVKKHFNEIADANDRLDLCKRSVAMDNMARLRLLDKDLELNVFPARPLDPALAAKLGLGQ